MNKSDKLDELIITTLNNREESPEHINNIIIAKFYKNNYEKLILAGSVIAGIFQGLLLLLIGIRFSWNLYVAIPIVLAGLFTINSTIVLSLILKYKGIGGGIYI